jgi:hypothetical protein
MRCLITGEETPGACPICIMENADEGGPCLKCKEFLRSEALKIAREAVEKMRQRNAS